MQASRQRSLKIGTGVAGLALLLVIVAAANLILANLRLRVDLTAEHLYSLSPGTRQLVGKLADDVTVKLYFNRSSSDVPVELKTYARHVEDLLREFHLASRGRIALETYDPKPDSDEEEWAQRYGLEPQPTGPFAPAIYFGLVARCGSNEQVIPALSPRDDAKLEYAIARLVARVAFPKKPVVGVLSSLPVMGTPPNPMMGMNRGDEGWLAFKDLKNDYDVRTVPAESDRIDPEIGTLIVIHPKALNDQALYAIDQFVLRGGHLLACVDPSSAIDARQSNPENPMMRMMGGGAPSTLGKLFDAWGVGFDTGKVVADLRAITRLAGQGQVMESPTFLSLQAQGFNRTDLLTAPLDRIMLPYAGSFVDRTGGKLAFTPLLFSSADASCPLDAMGASFATVTSIRSQFKSDNMRHVLAARLTGTFQTAFPNGPSGTEGATNRPPDQLVSGASVVVLFADTDFLADEYCVRAVPNFLGQQSYEPLNDNLVLFGNAVEQLAGRAELIGVRARGNLNRPFKLVDELEYKAMLAWQKQEEALTKQLEDTRRQLQELQQQKPGATQKIMLSTEARVAIEKFRDTEVQVNRQLKQVRKNLRGDIETLGVWVKTANIAAVPLLVIVFGVCRCVWRRRRS